MPLKRCPKCRGKVKFAALSRKYWCWNCAKFFAQEDILIFYSLKQFKEIENKKNERRNSIISVKHSRN